MNNILFSAYSGILEIAFGLNTAFALIRFLYDQRSSRLLESLDHLNTLVQATDIPSEAKKAIESKRIGALFVLFRTRKNAEVYVDQYVKITALMALFSLSMIMLSVSLPTIRVPVWLGMILSIILLAPVPSCLFHLTLKTRGDLSKGEKLKNEARDALLVATKSKTNT